MLAVVVEIWQKIKYLELQHLIGKQELCSLRLQTLMKGAYRDAVLLL